MGQKHAFFFSELKESYSEQTLSKEELPSMLCSHLKSLRIEVGEEVNFLNGKGLIARAKCIQNKNWSFEILENKISASTKKRIHLFISPPKGDSWTQSLQQACEVGVNRIHLLKTQHNQNPQNKKLNFSRIERILQASCEQCQLAWVPEILEDWNELNENLFTTKDFHFVCADEDLSQIGKAFWGLKTEAVDKLRNSLDIALLIGPEGGWSDEERKLLHKHCNLINLGPQILRVPTAIVASIQSIRQSLQD